MKNVVRLLAVLLALTTGCSLMASRSQAKSPVADSLRMSICCNGAWETVEVASDAAAPAPGVPKPSLAMSAAKGTPPPALTPLPAEGWTAVRVPAGPLSGKGRPIGVWYRRTFDVPQDWNAPGRRFFVEIEKAGHYTAVFCNGRKLAEHFDQFSPIQADVTDALQFGKPNQIAVFVHDASGAYVRPGAAVADEATGLAYRPAGQSVTQRDWVGIVGDVTLSWRPTEGLGDVFVTPSFRNKTLSVSVATDLLKEAGPCIVRSAVLDGDRVVLTLPDAKSTTGKLVVLQAPWSDATPWNPPSLGTPKLYFLRTELVRDGKVIDRTFTRFGFREVWADGKTLMLNGKRLFLVGTWDPWLGRLRYNNDRRAIALDMEAMQTAGVNTIHGHWDNLGRTVLDVADEMGMLVVDGFYCNGQLGISPTPTADAQWEPWATDVTQAWARADRGHPSVVVWRAFCGLPQGLGDTGPWSQGITKAIHGVDPAALVCGAEIVTHAQGPYTDATNSAPDDGSQMAKRAATTDKPLLTNEIWASFTPFDLYQKFFTNFYTKTWQGGTAGLIVQHLSVAKTDGSFEAAWPSESGEGGRGGDPGLKKFANWSDPSKPAFALDQYGDLFAGLAKTITGIPPKPFDGMSVGQVLVSGSKPGTPVASSASSTPAASAAPAASPAPVFLVPDNPALAEATGVLPAADGTAWLVVPRPGPYRALQDGHAQPLTVAPAKTAAGPGFDYLQKVDLGGKK